MSITDMAMGRVFKDDPRQSKGAINSIDFHRTHDFLVAGHEHGHISLYNTYVGSKLGVLDCSRYGVSHIRYTHHPKCIIHASTKEQGDPLASHALRYLSHHDNRYLRFYKGHTEAVTSLSMSPKSDQFISTALDKKLLMWDLRTPQAQAHMDVPGQPYGCMDEEGLVFAVACNSGLISIFDARQYSAGPFLALPLPLLKHGLHDVAPISCMKFSPNAQHLMAVVQGKVFLMDTFDGSEVVTWDTGVEAGAPVPEADFSADGQYAISGTPEKHINVWQCPAATPEGQAAAPVPPDLMLPIRQWSKHPCAPTCAKFSPTRKLVVTACKVLVMWIPAASEMEGERERE